MENSEFKRFNLNTTNRHLVMMIIFGISALASYSCYAIISEMQEQTILKEAVEKDDIQNSKLDKILADANKTDTIVILVQNGTVEEAVGSISGLN